MDRNGQETHSGSSNLELAGIISPFDPSSHWPSFRVASSSQAWPLIRLAPLGSSFGYHSWWVGAPALRVIGPNTSVIQPTIFVTKIKSLIVKICYPAHSVIRPNTVLDNTVGFGFEVVYQDTIQFNSI